jgi:hypothetical protein
MHRGPNAETKREVQDQRIFQVPLPEGSLTHEGATSICEAVPFWIGAARVLLK